MRKIKKRKGIVKMWIILLVIVGGIAAVLIGGMVFDARSRREVKELVIENVDFAKLQDGTYTGEFVGKQGRLRNATVEVTIKSGEVSGIKIVKGAVDKDGKALELTHGKSVKDLFQNALNAKSLQVDVISGATLTSKAHLKALENALPKAQGH